MAWKVNKRNASEMVSALNTERESRNQSLILSIVESRIDFSEDLLISKVSRYGDSVWSWEDPANPRLRAHRSHILKIDWKHFEHYYNLTASIIDELKKYVFFRMNYSTVVFPETKTNGSPTSIVPQLQILSKFLSHVRSTISSGGVSLINDLSDIEMQDLRDCFESYPNAKDSRLKIVLGHLGSEVLSRHLDCGPLKWNRQDVITLSWEKKMSVPFDRLPDGLFSFLSNNAVKDVRQFLKALKIQAHDKTPIGRKNLYASSTSDFGELFEKYVKYRNDIWNDKAAAHRFASWAKRENIKYGLMDNLIHRARLGARIIIMLYTGARRSEFTGFKTNCLRRVNGSWMIVGTVIKNCDLNAPPEQDHWVAIPIVRDAVEVLKQTARVLDSDLLFHESYHFAHMSNKFLVSSAISNGVRRYLDFVDIENKWAGIRPYAHQFRTSLAFEMRKCSLGLPFITYQLKHTYNAMKRDLSDVTLGYGSIGSEAVQKAIRDAHLHALRELYHPDSPIAGGGAERHKNRREAYFRGMAHRGLGVDDVLRHLAKEGGMPLTDVGLGYCQGQGAKIVVDGVKSDPPCIGGLRCNPVRCQNGVIPEHKLPAWKKSLKENQTRLQDPDFAYARPYLTEATEEARAIIELFQIEGRRQKKL